MQKGYVVLGFLVPAHQEPAKPIHPTMGALDDPAACLLASIRAEILGFFTAGADVRGEAKFAKELTNLLIVIALVQTHALRPLGRGLRALNHRTFQGAPCQFHVMPVGTIDSYAEGYPMTLRQHTPLDALLTPISGVGAGFFPRLRAPWSSPRPYSANPNRCREVHRTVQHRSATSAETHPRPSIPETGRTPWTWHTGSSGSRRSTGSPSAAHRRWHRRTGGPPLADAHRQSGDYSPALVTPVLTPPRGHRRA